MKTLVKRSVSLFLTLVLLFTMTPFAALAEAAENEDEMDEAMAILEANEEETDLTVFSDEADDSEIINDEDAETGILNEDVFSDSLDDPDVEDDWIDWYTDDSENEDETEDSWENEEYWEEGQDATNTQDKDDLTLEDTIILRGYAYVLSRRETDVYITRNLTGGPIFTITEEDAILLVTEYNPQRPESVKIWFIGDDTPMTGYVSTYDLRDEPLTDEDVETYTDLYWWDWVETEAGEMYTFYVSGYATISADEYPNEEWVDDSYSDNQFDPIETDESYEYVDDEQPEDEEAIEEVPVLRSAVRGMSLTAAQSASSFTGSEDIRLGKESSNISGILVQNNGSSSTSIARHWVTVNGTEYTAFCVQASKSATSGRDGNLESSTDAGLQWIMINVSDSSDQDYALKQQAIWIYLGQSYSANDLKAGSRCTLSTDELRERLNSIVASANSASYNSRYELWVAYHKENRSYYQDMIFITSAPAPTPTPTPTATPYVPPTATPYVPPTATPYVPPTATPYVPPTATPYVPPTATPYVPPTATPYVPPTATPYVPPTATPYVPPTATPYVPPTATPYVPPTATPYVPPTATPYVPPTATPYVPPTATPEPTQGWIRIIKTDSMTGQGLSGIVFDIYQGSALVSSMTTNASGIATSEALTKGTYTIKERSVPTGYVADLVTLSCEVKAEQITSLTAENTPIQVRIKVIKTDAQTNQPLSGAEFTVKQRTTGAVVATLTTNAQGEAVTDLLPYGLYDVTESSVPAGYIDSGFSVTVNGSENGKTYIVEAENSPMQGGIRIVKTDKADGSPIAGVIFDIYQGSNLIASMTTNASGVAVSGELPKGSYSVRERALPTGYTGELFSADCQVTSGNVTDLSANNQPIQFAVRIIKTDALTHEPLAGAQFTIVRKDSGAVIETLTTNSNGEATSGLLRYGEYEIKETYVPANYIDSSFAVVVNGTEHGKTYIVKAENQPMAGGIRVSKTDKLDNSPISGVVFDIYQGNAVIGSMTTNEAGVAVSDSLPKGQYTVKERANPEGYVTDLVSLDCEVKPDETTKLSADNTPIQFRVKIIKTDSMTKQPLSGAVFTITRISGLPSHNGSDDGEVVATLTTDAHGEAVSDLLTWGVYEIKETVVPDHYVNTPFTATITGNENQMVYEIKAENEPTQGRIQISKTDRLDGSPIAGVVFDIYQGDQFIGSMTTDEAGIAISDPIPKGNYQVKEHENPAGYMADLVSLNCEVKSDETVKLSADNMPIQFRVRINKTDSLTQQPLSGAVFIITRISGLPSHNGSDDGEVVATLTTNEHGEAVSDLLTWGVYEVTETVFPAHYVNTPCTITVTGSENQKVYEIKAENEPTKGKIQITKVDKMDGQPIAGVVFDIYQGDQVVGSMTTDEKGVAVSEPIPKGQYTVKERANPEGYVADLVSLDAEVESDETTKLIADNTPIQFYIKIVKTDKLTKRPLAGAVFTVTRKIGLPSHNGADNGEVVATLTTNEKGEAISELLTWGQYEVTETTVPEHYVDNDFTIMVTGTENNKIYAIACENEPTRGWIRLLKTDNLDNHPIAGVLFDILQNGEVVSTMTTDVDGIAVSESLNKGKYTVREHENPTGYTAELVSLDCEVFSDQTTNLTASNTPIQFRIRVEKTDQLTGDPLPGAEFTITRKSGLPSHDGEGDGEVVSVLVTDSNGVAVSDLLTWGVYEVKESKVPVHFVDNHFSTTITGSEDNKTYTITCENEPTKGYIKIVKTDKLDRTVIEGVQFDIYYNDQYGEGPAATMITDKNGVAVSPALRKGTYIVKEHADPTGYVTDLVSMDCVVKSDETTNLNCTNTPIQGKIRIIKTDELTGEKLAGAEFTITRISGLPSHKGSNDGEVVAIIVTDADGIAISPLLTWGVYRVEETGVPTHYVDNHFSAEVTIDTEDLLTYDVPCENEPTKGWISLKKTDRLNGNPISGVQFDVYYDDQYGEGLATTMVTDENGIAMSEPIRKGRYIIKEHGATAGYVFEEVSLNCTVKSDEITELSATNQPVQVRLKLYKRDADEYAGDPAADPATRGDGILNGAVFQVLAGENITDRQGNILYEKGAVVVESLKTAGKDASVMTEELWPGVYEIVELTPPTGYQPTDKHTMVDATSAARQSQEAVITYEGVVCNEILYGCHAFVKFTGDNEIHNDAGIIETPEPGAVFNVYLKKAGSFDAARSFERDTITTDAYGKTQTKLLPYGIYTVHQTKAKEGYAIKAPFDIYIRGTEDVDNPPTMIVNNEAIRYRLRFIKVDAETGKTITLANTAFRLKDANGEYVTQTVHYPRTQVIDTFKTDADGTVTLPETVRYGLYFIEEFRAPEGYLIKTEELAVFVGDENMNQPGEAYLLEFEIEDEAVKGRIKVEKTGLQLTGFKEKEDQYGNTVMQPIYEEKRLAGAVFEVHAAETITGKDGTVWYEQDALADTITTTSDGPNVSKTLPLGRYYLVEVSAPDGYSFDDRHYEADLIYADDHTPLVETVVKVGNDYQPSEISLSKEKEVLQTVREGDTVRQIITNAPGEGFTFGLYNDNDIHYNGGTLMADTLVAVGMTDEEGKLTFSGNYPHGRYFIKELSAPAGWKINTERFTVTLDPAAADEDHVIRVMLSERVHDELIWYPVTLTKLDITGEKTLPGALIEVTNDKNEVIYRAYTDKNGQIPNIPVTPGAYTFREILAPSGYALNEAVMTFTVDQDGGITGDTTIRDDYTRVMLLKKDENGLPLAGVEFALTKRNGTMLMRKTSDADGRIVFEKIPYGEYTITETKALAGYQKHDVSIRLTVDGTFINQEEPLKTIINHPIILKLKKVDQDGKALPGAEYALINEFGEQMMTAVSDGTGILTFYKVPYGKYTVKELYAPDGYLLSKDTPEIVIDDSWQNSDAPLLTLTNHLKRLRYIKVDTSGKYLPGVEFSLINASNGEVVEVVTSNEKGEFIFTKFDYGFWLIRETKTPDGYCQMKDIPFSVDASWIEPAPLTCTNIPSHYEFVKTDNEGIPMAGVSFTLEDQEDNILRDLVSGDDGIVHVNDLTPGTYFIREIETWEGYTVSGETIEVVIDEHYIVPDEMYSLVNYPDIQTGVDQEITPLMYAGGVAMLAALVILLFILFRKLRHK